MKIKALIWAQTKGQYHATAEDQGDNKRCWARKNSNQFLVYMRRNVGKTAYTHHTRSFKSWVEALAHAKSWVSRGANERSI